MVGSAGQTDNLAKSNHSLRLKLLITRSQAVARIADRTASQQTNQRSLLQIASVFEIRDPKRIGAMTLTFQGHVTSSVMDYSIPQRSFPICFSDSFSVECRRTV